MTVTAQFAKNYLERRQAEIDALKRQGKDATEATPPPPTAPEPMTAIETRP